MLGSVWTAVQSTFAIKSVKQVMKTTLYRGGSTAIYDSTVMVNAKISWNFLGLSKSAAN